MQGNTENSSVSYSKRITFEGYRISDQYRNNFIFVSFSRKRKKKHLIARMDVTDAHNISISRIHLNTNIW